MLLLFFVNVYTLMHKHANASINFVIEYYKHAKRKPIHVTKNDYMH